MGYRQVCMTARICEIGIAARSASLPAKNLLGFGGVSDAAGERHSFPRIGLVAPSAAAVAASVGLEPLGWGQRSTAQECILGYVSPEILKHT